MARVAEIRPVVDGPKGFAERVKELERDGSLGPIPLAPPRFEPVVTRPGALERFLADRE